MPMVMVDSTAMPDAPTIRVDDEGGAYQAAIHLLDLGHRDVLILAIAPPDVASATPSRRTEPGGVDGDGVGPDRARGYERAFRERGVPLDSLERRPARSTIQDGAEAFRGVWAAGRRPTAVLAMSDAIAIGVMSAARDIGVRIPSDLSVVGFDDIELAAQIQPSLTTIHQPTRAKGEAAMRQLLALLDSRGAPTDPAADAEEVPILATYLVVRDSTGPASPDLTSTITGHG
jgi:LacI family repressor for deo operon, udp, cdd, tsx, nupC, and nupG